jgi:hypothetical protein
MPTTIHRLVGVYHADGGLRGELTYGVGKLRGTAHCALCDITHRGIRRKQAWVDWTSSTPVAVDVVHLNERTPGVAAAREGRTPCVLADTDAGLVVILGPEQLDAASGDVEARRA